MRQATHTPYPNLYKRFVFNDEATTRREGGTPTDVTFDKGKAVFNGTSSHINKNNLFNEIRTATSNSILIKFNLSNISGTQRLISFGATTQDRAIQISVINGVLYFADGGNPTKWILKTDNAVVEVNKEYTVVCVQNGISPIIYFNGVAIAQTFTTSTDKTTWFNSYYGIIDNINIGAVNYASLGYAGFLNGDIDFIEIYEGTLTASEVANLYSGKWNKELSLGFNNAITNGTFDSNVAGWTKTAGTFSWESGYAKYITTGSYQRSYQAINLEIGETYILSALLKSNGTNAAFVATQDGTSTPFLEYISSTNNEWTLKTKEFVAESTDNYIVLSLNNSGTFYYDDVKLYKKNSPNYNLLIDFDSTNGVLDLGDLNDTYSQSGVTLHKTGNNYAALFNGNGNITIGNIGTVATLNFILYYDGTNQSGIIDLDGTNTVSHSSGTLSYPTGNAYINGVDTNTLTVGWNFITILITTPIAASAFRIGYDGSNYFTGLIAKCSAQDVQLSLIEHTQWWTENLKHTD